MAVRDRVRPWIRRHPVISFVVIAFVYTWSYDGAIYVLFGEQPWPYLIMPGTWGVVLGAGIITWTTGGDVREWAQQGTMWNVDYRWYLVALGLPVGVAELEGLLWLLAGGEVQFRGESPTTFLSLYVGGFLLVTFFGGGLEEFGWRGFAQPRLQERYSALVAGSGIGIVWSVWHLPLFVLFEFPWYDRFLPYLLWTVAWSLVLTWMYNGSGGSVLIVMFAHGIGNNPPVFEPIGTAPVSDSAKLIIIYAETLALVAVIGLLLVLYGRRHLAGAAPEPRIPGGFTD